MVNNFRYFLRIYENVCNLKKEEEQNEWKDGKSQGKISSAFKSLSMWSTWTTLNNFERAYQTCC